MYKFLGEGRMELKLVFGHGQLVLASGFLLAARRVFS